MVAITATNSATLSMQASVTKSRLEQARREAAQAEANAETLRSQAQEQDQVAEKAHARERTLAVGDASSTARAAPVRSEAAAPSAPASSAPKLAGQPGASYVETLNTLLEGRNSPAQASYTFPVQKNLVISSLFQAANQVWQATPPDTRVAKLYGAGRSASATATAGTGSRLNTTA